MKKYLLILVSFIMMGCGDESDMIKTVDYVDIERFMGDWYVIANIPTFIEKGAHNAIESYKLEEDGSIATTFTFRKNSVKGPEKVYKPTGWVYNQETNAEWRMQFLWPFKLPYLVVGLAEDYSYTVISVPSKSYLWIMAREPQMDDTLYQTIVAQLESDGYPIEKIQKIVQTW